ncbi:hypothetical protein ACFQJC_08380 [Haloferax namakaokahaiae]|uniref:DUF8097 domain-containing protein n=1 Tax=Haloferax namakaokahaiae TaxID=1748331 RepID=A0ABD5ZE09_9EURY
MISRRTRARAEFAVALFSAVVIRYSRRKLRDHEGGRGPLPPLSNGSVALGAVWQGVRLWSYDRDIWGFRTSRSRRFLFALFIFGARRALFSRSESFRSSFGFGRVVGTIGYRFWYGVMRPLPGTED